MNLFRSEEHIERWLGGRAPGATTSVETLAALARGWWADRLAPAWRPRPPAEGQRILSSLGLIGPFWQLPGA